MSDATRNAYAVEPESLSVGELNAAVRFLREEVHQTKLRAQKAEGDLAASERAYLLVVDAVCRSSTGPEDVARQARETREALGEAMKERDEALARAEEAERTFRCVEETEQYRAVERLAATCDREAKDEHKARLAAEQSLAELRGAVAGWRKTMPGYSSSSLTSAERALCLAYDGSAPAPAPEEPCPRCDDHEGRKPSEVAPPLADGALTRWPIVDVLERLADAADHLRSAHNCDAHGHEGVLYAAQAARLHVAALRVLPPVDQTPETGPVLGRCKSAANEEPHTRCPDCIGWEPEPAPETGRRLCATCHCRSWACDPECLCACHGPAPAAPTRAPNAAKEE